MAVRFGNYYADISEALGELHTVGGTVLIPHENGYLVVEADSVVPETPAPREPYVPRKSKCRCVGIKHPGGCNSEARFIPGYLSR